MEERMTDINMEGRMSQEEIQGQIDALTQQISQRANQLASQDPYVARLTGQIEVYRTFIESEVEEGELISSNGEEE
tara:strand:- start:78 stop:305 length:228 start_codon:yes stop_codon:yes gene_type:complete